MGTTGDLTKSDDLTNAMKDLLGGSTRTWDLRIKPNFLKWLAPDGGAFDLEPENVGKLWDATVPKDPAELERRLEQVYEKSANGTARNAVVSRIAGNCRALIAAAAAAGAVKKYCTEGKDDAATQFVKWSNRVFTSLPGAGQAAPWVADRPQLSGQIGGQARDIVNDWYANLPAASIDRVTTTAWFWTLYWLKSLPECDHTLQVPVAYYAKNKGHLAYLKIEHYPQPEKWSACKLFLIEHPANALDPFMADLLNTVQNAFDWGFAGESGVVTWRLDRKTTHNDIVLGGDSLGGAAGTGFRLLAEKRPFDPKCLILGAVKCEDWSRSDDPKLIPRACEQEKLDAARKGKCTRAVIPPLTTAIENGNRITTDQKEDLQRDDLVVYEKERLSGACDMAAGDLVLLRQCLEQERKNLLELAGMRIFGGTNAFNDWSAFESLYIPMNVARSLRPKLSEAEYRELEQRRQMGDWQALDAVALQRRHDNGDDRRQVDSRETVSWSSLRAQLHRAVVVGDPGFGKTTLLWHEVGTTVEETLQVLKNPCSTASEIKLAFFISAAEWDQSLEAKTRDDAKGKAVSSIVATLLNRYGFPEGADHRADAEALLKTRLTRGDCLIVIDGLDEVPLSRTQVVNAAIGRLAENERLRILATSRLASYTGPPITIDDEWELELLAFEPHQVQDAVKAWFRRAGETELADNFIARLEQQPEQVRHVLRSPLMLRFALKLCEPRLNKRTQLPVWKRSVALYDALVVDLVYRLCETKGRANVGTTDQRWRWIDAAADVFLELWLRNPSQSFWTPRELGDATARALGLADKEFQNLVDDLIRSGLLTPAGAPNDDHSALMLTHRSLAEYLAAYALARRYNGQHPGRDQAPQPPLTYEQLARRAWLADWQPVVIMLAGLLDDPMPLLKALYAEKHRDLSHDRLALVLKCLAEVDEDKRGKETSKLPQLATTLTERVLSLALWREEKDTAIESIGATLTAINASVSWQKFLPTGYKRHFPSEKVRLRELVDCKVLWTSEIGRGYVSDVRDHVLPFIQTPKAKVLAALHAQHRFVGGLWLQHIESMFKSDSEYGDIATAVDALCPILTDLGKANDLAKSCYDDASWVQRKLMGALARLGPEAATDEMINALVGFLGPDEAFDVDILDLNQATADVRVGRIRQRRTAA